MAMPRWISALTFVVILFLLGLPLAAQAGGEEPAVTLNGRSLERGPLFDTLYGQRPNASLALSKQAATPGDQDQGNWWQRRSPAAKGAIVGAAVGAGLGAVGGVSYCQNEPGQNCGGQAESAFALLYAGLGAGVGALIGAVLD